MKKVKILRPLKGDKKKMLNLCIKNSDMIIKDLVIKKIRRKEYIPKVLSELQESERGRNIQTRKQTDKQRDNDGKTPTANAIMRMLLVMNFRK